MKQKTILSKECDWCKTKLILNDKESDSYVVNAEHLVFCKNHTQGQEPEKDCMAEYVNNKPTIAKPKIEEFKKLMDKNVAIKKLNELDQFLNNKR